MLTAGDLAIQIPLTAGEDEWQGANKGGSSVCALGIAQSSEKELVYLFTCLLVYLFAYLHTYSRHGCLRQVYCYCRLLLLKF